MKSGWLFYQTRTQKERSNKLDAWRYETYPKKGGEEIFRRGRSREMQDPPWPKEGTEITGPGREKAGTRGGAREGLEVGSREGCGCCKKGRKVKQEE